MLVGKYTDLKDSYMSVTKALEHSAFRCHQKLVLHVCPSVRPSYCSPILPPSHPRLLSRLLLLSCLLFRTQPLLHLLCDLAWLTNDMVATAQWVESSDLEPQTQEINPAKYHDAWKTIVGAKYVPLPPFPDLQLWRLC